MEKMQMEKQRRQKTRENSNDAKKSETAGKK